jgi:hypothetical protein
MARSTIRSPMAAARNIVLSPIGTGMQNQDFPPPIIVLSPPGMPGQTLAAALGQNPAACGIPDLNLELMATVDVLQRELTGIRTPQIHGLLRTLAQLFAGEQTAAAVEMANRWLMRRRYMSTGDVARGIAAHVAPRRMVTSVTAAIFDRASQRRLGAAFPAAVFVHLQLHPHVYGRLLWAGIPGQVAMQLAGAMDETTLPATPDPQELWLMAETAIAAFLADLPESRVLRLKVEDLAAAPKPALAALARRLGLPADARAVARMAAPERSVFAGPGPMGAHTPGNIQSFAALAAGLPDSATARLSGALPWRPDAAGFRAEVSARAREIGYG